MSSTVQDLRGLLEARDLPGFLKLYEAERIRFLGQPGLWQCTQRILPTILRELFSASRAPAECVVHLWRMVRSGHLLMVDTDVLEAINARIDQALTELEGPTAMPAQKLHTYEEAIAEPAPPPAVRSQAAEPAVAMRRIVIGSAYAMGVVSMSDAFNFKKNLCASSQELEFLKAVRQFFPGFRAYPNLPLRNFIDLDALGTFADDEMRRFCWSSQVDVLLCTEDEDPVAGIELDSLHHDNGDAQERDALKNRLFQLAGVPLVRIRADDTSNVRAEDFYDLLVAEKDTLEALRPRRLRPRRNHDMLVPAEVQVRKYAGAAA